MQTPSGCKKTASSHPVNLLNAELFLDGDVCWVSPPGLHLSFNNIANLPPSRLVQVTELTEKMDQVTKENKFTKGAILNIQTRSIHDNIIFSGITEQPTTNPEALIKKFIKTQLKLLVETVQSNHFPLCTLTWIMLEQITSAHYRKSGKSQIQRTNKSYGKDLKGTQYRLNDEEGATVTLLARAVGCCL